MTGKVQLSGGQVLSGVHPKSRCKGRPCSIHNPSEHHMRDWVMVWRSDRQLMERICPLHGVGHPDPDHMDWLRRSYGDEIAKVEGIHGCCGCC